MIAAIIISILVSFLLALLFMPIRIIADTDNQDYHIAMPLFFRIKLITDQEALMKIKIRVLGISTEINPLKKNKAKETKEKKYSKYFLSTRGAKSYKLVFAMINTFTIKRLYADIDTGNFPLNAQLIPIASTVNGININARINFENRNTFDIKIVTQIYKLIATGIFYSLRKNKNL